MHRLCLVPEAGKIWVVAPQGTIALSRESVEDAFSQAAEQELRETTNAAVDSARATAEKAAYGEFRNEDAFSVQKLSGLTHRASCVPSSHRRKSRGHEAARARCH
jgi:hypothetical protein